MKNKYIFFISLILSYSINLNGVKTTMIDKPITEMVVKGIINKLPEAEKNELILNITSDLIKTEVDKETIIKDLKKAIEKIQNKYNRK